jgi:hypothetical protein
MTYLKQSRLACAIGIVILHLAGASSAFAQTTGTLSGAAVDQQGGVLPGVTVTAVHQPTGTEYTSTTDAEGRFQIPNVRVGGPYRVTAALSGFNDFVQSDITVSLGESSQVELRMGLAAVSETITVTAQTTFAETRAGTSDSVSRETIEQLPSVQRSLTDFARISPYFNQTNQNGGDSFLSVAGRNNRYNGIQIDGAVNNDVFGLSDSGTPGGQTGAQPISLDAIQELQLVVAPYDVRQGGFSGGGVNAITRSGTNAFSGTAYLFGRNQSLTGSIPSQTDPNAPKSKIGKFKDSQGGGSIGGPLLRNQAFFFTNVELTRKDTPSGYSINGGTGQSFGHQAEAQRFRDILTNTYGYDPGGLDEFGRRNNSNKVFIRTDFNLTTAHRLTVRHNYVDSVADIGFPSLTQYNFADFYYQFKNTTNSTVAQLDSSFGNMFNELRVSYQEFNDRRTGQPDYAPFPSIRVDLPDGANLRAGTENFSVQNELDQRVIEVTNDLTVLKGRHSFTFGTHNEFLKFRNLFIRDNWGTYRFTNLDNLAAGVASSYDYSFSNTSDPQQAARFSVRQLGFYAGDQWRLAPNFTLTYGARIDIPNFPDKPSANPVAVANFGYATDVVPSPTMFSPRAGFNWDLANGSEKRQQVRGGAGLFTGRTPYVWLSNQYGNTGIDFTRVNVPFNAATRVTFVANPLAQPKNVGGAATNEIDVVDPDYKFPSLFRGNLAYDRDLGFWGLIGTGEVLFSKNVQEIKYQNLNIVQTGSVAADGRALYGRQVPSLADVILLTNTSDGSQWSFSFKVDRPFRNGFFLTGSYLYNDATSIGDGTNSQAASNWGNVYVGSGDVNDPQLTRSNFSVGNMIKVSATIPIPLGPVRSYASIYYNGQSGRPYVLTFNGDVNGDTRTANDILFVPTSANDVTVTNGTFAQLQSYLAGDNSTENSSGGIPERNIGRSPWTNGLDVRYAVTIPTGGRTRVELTMDVLNILNLFNDSDGWQLFPNFNGPAPIIGSYDRTTGKLVYNLSTLNSPTFATFQRDNIRSRWQAQWGLRVRF